MRGRVRKSRSHAHSSAPANSHLVRNISPKTILSSAGRWYDQHQQTPLFPFGFWSFIYEHSIQQPESETRRHLRIRKSYVKNTGTRTASDVVQVYVAERKCAEEPPSQLKGFEKVVLRPGETTTVNLKIPLASLSSWSEKNNDWKPCKGKYEFKVGQSSRTILLSSASRWANRGRNR